MPALAAPIDEPPSGELLVEGHLVYTTVDSYYQEPDGAQARSPTSAAPPAPGLAGGGALIRYERFAGVLWANDQFLVPPRTESTEGLGSGAVMRSSYGAAMAVLVRGDDGRVVREPCGGAIIAVRAGDPIPRSALVSVDGADPLFGHNAGTDNAWLGVSRQEGVTSDGLATATASSLLGDVPLVGHDYVESYRVTDPNDRAFVIDRYDAILQLPGQETAHAYPFWVTNFWGTEAFTPDVDTFRTGAFGPGHCEELAPVTGLAGPFGGLLCGMRMDGLASLSEPVFVDDPCMSYQEPTRDGRCYTGVDHNETRGCDRGEAPERRYQALLYFDWDDLVADGPTKDHCNFDPDLTVWWPEPSVGGCNPALSPDTNACASGTEWSCPGERPWESLPGRDDREGASHASHPLAPPHLESEPCPVPGMPNPVNHGGSPLGRDGPCSYEHATSRVDVWYSAYGRPAPPAVRAFVIDDTFGSSEDFLDFHTMYPGVP